MYVTYQDSTYDRVTVVRCISMIGVDELRRAEEGEEKGEGASRGLKRTIE